MFWLRNKKNDFQIRTLTWGPEDFSRRLRDFPVLFKADLVFKDFSRKPSQFKYFSSLCQPCAMFGVHRNGPCYK